MTLTRPFCPLLAWWFFVIIPGFQGVPTVTKVGPFAVMAQCDHYRVWAESQIPHQYFSDCWSDEDP